VPAPTASGCGPGGGHKGRPYEGECLADPFNLIDALSPDSRCAIALTAHRADVCGLQCRSPPFQHETTDLSPVGEADIVIDRIMESRP
jgi:hypothetical protein